PEEVPQRTEVEVEVLRLEAELGSELLHALVELHEGLAEPLDLLVGERAAVDAPQCLTLHELTQELDDRQHELREPALDALRVGVDAPRERVIEPRMIVGEEVEVRRGVEELVGHASAKL